MSERMRRDDSGMAMITAILVCTIVLFLSMTSVAMSDHSFSSQRVDRKRVQTFHAAEAGIDHALQVLQTTARASLPCASPLVATLGTGPYTADYSVTFTYWANDSATGAPMTCPLSTEPKLVLLSSVGDSSDPLGSRRRIEVTAQLASPLTTSAFNRTVFSDQSINVNNNVTIAGYQGNDATLFTNGNFVCTNSQSLSGNLYAQGSASLDNSCSVSGDLWAKDGVTLANKSSVGRDATSGTGAVALSGQATIGRNARAATTITTSNSSQVLGLKIPTSPAGAPPSAAFPQLYWSEAAWLSAGYQVKTESSCTNARNTITSGSGINNDRYVVYVNGAGCRLDFSGVTVNVPYDLAIVSPGGITFGNQTTFRSSDGTMKQLHLIVPYGSTCTPATSQGNIELEINTDIAAPLETFLFSPCTIMVANSGVLQGQVYGAKVDFTNLATLAFRPAKGVPGYNTTVTSTIARQVSVLYKREVVA
jgi:hypothetical protein